MRVVSIFLTAAAAALMVWSAAARAQQGADRGDITFSLGSVTPRIAAQPCTQSAFSAVTHRTGSVLGELNEKQADLFRARLEMLRASNGWSEREMLVYAGPMMQDEAVLAIDAQNQRLVSELTSLSHDGAQGRDQRCKMLERVEAIMAQLIANTRKRWRLLLAGIDTALISADQASALASDDVLASDGLVLQD